MAKVNFKRYNTKEEALASDIIDGNYIVTKDGGNYADFDGKRVPIGGTPDTEMSDTSENSVQNKVVKKYVDDKFDKLSVYSTEEQVIGKWIDGKPLYKKTIYSTILTGNLGIENIDFLRFKNFNTIYNNEILFPSGRYISAADNLDFFINKQSLTFTASFGARWKDNINYILFDIEYTKTTD